MREQDNLVDDFPLWHSPSQHGRKFPFHSAWKRLELLSFAGPLQLSLRSRHSLRRVVSLGGFIILSLTSVLLLMHARRGPPVVIGAAPNPFYCSTWNTAPDIPEHAWPEQIAQYLEWVQYDNDDFHHLMPRHQHNTSEQTASLRGQTNIRNATSADWPVPPTHWEKPTGFRVVVIVFFGRPHTVDLLDCYLHRNLVHQGGYLDEVHFIEHTTNPEDLEWLHNLVNATPGYRALQVAPHCREHPHQEDCRYERIWEHFATDNDTLYIKIDDDVVYIHEDTIPRLVHRRMDYAQPFSISANIINSPLTAWMHYHLGAIHPYLPEDDPLTRSRKGEPTWRASELPTHPNDHLFDDFAFGPTNPTALINSAVSERDWWWLMDRAPYPGHRWLPLTQNTTSLLYTPISQINTDPWGIGVHHWALAAQQHYSLLQNIEERKLYRYYMASVPPYGDGIFNPQYSRYNLNFIAVWGKDVVQGAHVRREQILDKDGVQRSVLLSQMRDDEKNITTDIPRALGRPMVIDVQALVAHMHFHDQEHGMQMTDLLDRWRAYANENVCATNRQKSVPRQANGLGWTTANARNDWYQCPWIKNDNITTTGQAMASETIIR